MTNIKKLLFNRRCLLIVSAVWSFQVLLIILLKSKSLQMNLATEPFVSYENSSMHEVARRMELRRKHFKEMCISLGLNQPGDDRLHKPYSWEYLINHKYHLIWCTVFKAASTSWMYNFLVLLGYYGPCLSTNKNGFLKIIREEYSRPSVEELREAFATSISFLIVRHPLERVLSAYRQKLEGLPHRYYHKLGNDIVSTYRCKNSTSLNDVVGPTFPEFVEYLIDSFHKNRYLDEHWTPIAEFCTPCMFDFKVIAHTETLEEDQKYLIRLAQLEHIIRPQWKNANKHTTSQKDIIRKYYSQLTQTKINQLYSVYKYDFELFNYTLNGYLEHGKLDNRTKQNY